MVQPKLEEPISEPTFYPPSFTPSLQIPVTPQSNSSQVNDNFKNGEIKNSERPLSGFVRTATQSTIMSGITSFNSKMGILNKSGEKGNSFSGESPRKAIEMTESYDFWASLSIGLCCIGALPGVFEASLGVVHVYGGSSMYMIAWPISGIFLCCLVAILGEMASTYPVAGAMFTWTFRLCRSSTRFNSSARYTSWIVGSITLTAHILTQIVLAYQLSKQIQETIAFSLYSTAIDYNLSIWKTIFIAWGMTALAGLVCCSRLSKSPLAWKLVGIFIGLSFLTVNIIMLTHASRIRGLKELFTSYTNFAGIASPTYTYLVGWCLSSLASGSESCAHIAENTKNPSRNVPLTMLWSTIISYLGGWVTIAIMLSTVNLDDLNSNSFGPIGLLSNTIPATYATAILILIILLMFLQNIAQLLATSRFIWALARESALPFSEFFVKITPTHRLPVNATIFLVILTTLPMMLISISVKLVSIIVLEGAALTILLAYTIPVIIYLSCGENALHGDGRSLYSLRNWSRPVGFFSVPFFILAACCLCLPTGYPVDRLSAPYSPAVVLGVMFFSTLSWVLYGNSHYVGPIKGLTLRTLGFSASLPTSSNSTIKKSTKMDNLEGGKSTSAAIGRDAQFFESTVHTLNHTGGTETEGDSEWSSREFTGESNFSSGASRV